MTREQKRFAQLVRGLVRKYVKQQREAPAFSLWVSAAGDPRAAAVFPVGAARDDDHIRVQAVEAIEASGAHWCAFGRLLHDVSSDEPTATALFGLVVFGRGQPSPVAWVVDVVAGRIGAWDEWTAGESVVEQFAFAQAALDRVARREEEQGRAGDRGA